MHVNKQDQRPLPVVFVEKRSRWRCRSRRTSRSWTSRPTGPGSTGSPGPVALGPVEPLL